MSDLLVGSKAYQARLNFWFDTINMQLEGASKVESRLMGLDVLPRILVALENQSHQCESCNAYLQNLTLQLDGLSDIVAGHNAGGKSQLETLGRDVMSHFQTSHGMYPKGKRKASISLWAMLLGMVLGALLGFAGLLTSWGGGLVLGWLAGMTVGVVGGAVVEGRLRKKHLLF